MANLFYVIGASGVGKDALLNYARQQMPPQTQVMFAHRYITRPMTAAGENHVALSYQEFMTRIQHGCFAMHWYSHKTWYGVGVEIEHWLAADLDVVMNGSRDFLAQAAQAYPNLVPVQIYANEATLRQRLTARGREQGGAIEARLSLARIRDQQLSHPKLVRIANEGELADAGNQLVSLINQAR